MMYYESYMPKIKTDAYQCGRCGHVWMPRKIEKEPKVCPKCKSPYWNEPRIENRKVEERKRQKKSERKTEGERERQ
jgi:predicted  nucleic acid-binding Zn-ribbon protein